MDKTIMSTVENQTKETTSETVSENTVNDDALKEAIDDQLKKIQRQNLLVGAQTACSVILNKIVVAMNKPGKRTMNDYKRVIKDIEQFCRVGVSRKVNEDGETEVVDENNTKLMEETNESNVNESN